MSATMLLAVDTARYEPSRHVNAAIELVRDLASRTGDTVIVLHVHEFAVGRFGRLQVCCPDGEGEKLVASVVAELKAAGASADSDIRDADLGYIARAIVTASNDHDARVLVLGSTTRHDLPPVTFGSVAGRLLHLSTRPVLIVPMHRPESSEHPAG
jgi:nucleotide-binding universal stress UspA family protein